ncbi:hypothetical protein [Kitasatospora sp. NPDC058046]|uniref:AMP-binding enzyme n=1 Tax=Kitasatospora sp. NPDC058046 TaxID=3346312 RepID=UPI0036DCCC8E
MRSDGNLEFHRREDRQVKVHGYRVELNEVESQLRICPGIRDAVVLALRAGRADELVAWFVATESADDPQLPGRVRKYLNARLPSAMVPSIFLPRAALPLNSAGKIDRSVLGQGAERGHATRRSRWRCPPLSGRRRAGHVSPPATDSGLHVPSPRPE